jgi:hypothetical protein
VGFLYIQSGLFGFNPFQKTGFVDDGPSMISVANQFALIPQLNLVFNLTAVEAGDLSPQPNLTAQRCRRSMPDIDSNSDGGLTFGKTLIRHSPAYLFDKGDHGGRGKNLQTPAADVIGCHLLVNRQSGFFDQSNLDLIHHFYASVS